MSSPPLSPAATRVVVEHIDSVAQLDFLMLLESDHALTWTTAHIAAALRVSEPWVEEQVILFEQRGFLARTVAGVRYAPRADLGEAVGEIKSAYRQFSVALVTFIYTKPSRSLLSFSDAFRLRSAEPPRPATPAQPPSTPPPEGP